MSNHGMTDMTDTKLRSMYRARYGEPWTGAREALAWIWQTACAVGYDSPQKRQVAVDLMREQARGRVVMAGPQLETKNG